MTACSDAEGGTEGSSNEESGASPESGGQGDSPSAVLNQLGREVILPAYQEFAAAARQLQAAAAALHTAHQGDPANVEARLNEAQAAWKTAMSSWQVLEVMQVGPAASSIYDLGGLDLRDEIYSWPTTNECRVDQELADAGYTAQSFFADELVNVYGLDAIEYLLFYREPNNSCPPQLGINQGPWAALGQPEIDRRRAEYAAIAAQNLVVRADELVQAWSPEGGNFVADLSKPGSSHSPYASEAEALDQLFRALFYVELQTKDQKLSALTSSLGDCSTGVCPDALESPFAQHSRENILANLDGARRLLSGLKPGEVLDLGATRGFYRLLELRGAAALGQQIDGLAVQAHSQVSAQTSSLSELLGQQAGGVEAIHGSVKQLTDQLKGALVMALSLTIPQEGSGDND